MEDIQETNSTEVYTFLNAAEKVLNECAERQPMHYKEISRIAIEKGWLQTDGKTPKDTMRVSISNEIKNKPGQSRFARDPHRPGYIYLTKWGSLESSEQKEENEPEIKSETYTFLKAAEMALEESGKRMSYKEIIDAAQKGGWIKTDGKTPESTLNSAINMDIINKQGRSIFKKVKYKGKTCVVLAKNPIVDEENKKVKEKLLELLSQMDDASFEKFVAEIIMPALGIENCGHTQKSRDGGVDATGELTMHNVKWAVKVQAKRYDRKHTVGRPIVQALRGTLKYVGEMGIVVTTSGFSSDAWEDAQSDNKHLIGLIDGEELADIIIKKNWDDVEDEKKPFTMRTVIKVNEEYFENYGKDTPDAGSES